MKLCYTLTRCLTAVAICFVSAVTAFAQTICIDPGHPSEIGRGTKGVHITELEAVWKIALLLEKELKTAGYRVVKTKMTRDQFVRNIDRAKIANKAKAELFVRLHCDAASGSGFATYYPSQTGKHLSKSGPSPTVIRESKRVATILNNVMKQKLHGIHPNRGLFTDLQTAIGKKQGALTGSIYSEVPVVLFELAVLTNSRDDKWMAQPRSQQLLAEALATGIQAAIPRMKVKPNPSAPLRSI